jgi:hypothetical protein
MTKRSGKRRPVSRAEVREFMGKAEEWLETAMDALGQERFTAATGTAIHAGINAADAICGARLGQRSSAEAHNEAVVLLRSVPIDGPGAANYLSRLLQKKHKAEYDPRPISPSSAEAAVNQ